jgi:hypothetical protein
LLRGYDAVEDPMSRFSDDDYKPSLDVDDASTDDDVPDFEMMDQEGPDSVRLATQMTVEELNELNAGFPEFDPTQMLGVFGEPIMYDKDADGNPIGGAPLCAFFFFSSCIIFFVKLIPTFVQRLHNFLRMSFSNQLKLLMDLSLCLLLPCRNHHTMSSFMITTSKWMMPWNNSSSNSLWTHCHPSFKI